MVAYSSEREDNENNDSILNYPIFNSYCTVSDLLGRSELLSHPSTYMSTLVRIGYEPLPPKLTRSIFGKTRLQLPGFFTYMKFIAQTDGFWGIYRGLKYNVMFSVIYQFSAVNARHYFVNNYYPVLKSEEAKYENKDNLATSIVCESLTRITALAVAYPFHLMMVRCISQFIGRETHYDTIASAINDIYATGGFAGFYSGFVPFAIGECCFVLIESTLFYFIYDKLHRVYGYDVNTSFLKSAVSIIARTITYPFKVVSTVMSCNGNNSRSLAASAYTAPEFENWIECWQTLWARGEIKRGSSIFWRNQPITSSIMFQPMITPTHLKRI